MLLWKRQELATHSQVSGSVCAHRFFIFNGLHIQRKAAIVCFSISEKFFNVESDEQVRRKFHFIPSFLGILVINVFCLHFH